MLQSSFSVNTVSRNGNIGIKGFKQQQEIVTSIWARPSVLRGSSIFDDRYIKRLLLVSEFNA